MGVVGEGFVGCQESTGKTGDRHAEEVNLTLLPESDNLQRIVDSCWCWSNIGVYRHQTLDKSYLESLRLVEMISQPVV